MNNEWVVPIVTALGGGAIVELIRRRTVVATHTLDDAVAIRKELREEVAALKKAAIDREVVYNARLENMQREVDHWRTLFYEQGEKFLLLNREQASKYNLLEREYNQLREDYDDMEDKNQKLRKLYDSPGFHKMLKIYDIDHLIDETKAIVEEEKRKNPPPPGAD